MANHQIFGHVVVIFYCTIFGIAFFVASTLYLVNIQRVESLQRSRCPEGFELLPTPIPLSTSSSSSSHNGGCTGEVIHNWRIWANMGLVYGIVWFFLGLFLLWPIMWRVCFVNNPNIYVLDAATLPLAKKRRNNNGQFFKNMATNIIITAHQQGLQKGQLKKQQRMDELKETRFWSSCGSCLKIMYIALIDLVMVCLWLTSLIIPALIAVSLGVTHAFQPLDRQLHSPALSLFSVCVLSLIFVIVSSCVIMCDNTINWSSMDTSSSSSSSFDSEDQRKRRPDGGDLEAGREKGTAG